MIFRQVDLLGLSESVEKTTKLHQKRKKERNREGISTKPKIIILINANKV
jgi:hypothetical protein